MGGRRAKWDTPELRAAKALRRKAIASYVREPVNRFDVEQGCYERYRVRGGWVEVIDRGAGNAYFNVRERMRDGRVTILSTAPMHFIEARDLAETYVNELYEGYEKVRKTD